MKKGLFNYISDNNNNKFVRLLSIYFLYNIFLFFPNKIDIALID